jgi:hypothetical protein
VQKPKMLARHQHLPVPNVGQASSLPLSFRVAVFCEA